MCLYVCVQYIAILYSISCFFNLRNHTCTVQAHTHTHTNFEQNHCKIFLRLLTSYSSKNTSTMHDWEGWYEARHRYSPTLHSGHHTVWLAGSAWYQSSCHGADMRLSWIKCTQWTPASCRSTMFHRCCSQPCWVGGQRWNTAQDSCNHCPQYLFYGVWLPVNNENTI